MKRILALSLALCALLCACGVKKSEDTPVAAFSGGYTYEESFEQDGEVYLTVSVKYPRMEGEEGRAGAFNAFFEERLAETKEYIKAETEPQAREMAGHLDPDQPCTYEVRWEKSRVDGDCISVLCTTYVYLGGAHPGQSLAAYNFDSEGGLITADRLFGGEQGQYLEKLRGLILAQVDAADQEKQEEYGGYYEGWRDDMMNEWQTTDFLVTEEGVRIFWQEYAIAPYAAGIPQFDLSWEELGDMAAGEWRK